MLAYLIITGAVLLQKQPSLAQINPDGFNIYKGLYPDFLRKSGEPLSFFEPNDDTSIYAFRRPSLLIMPEADATKEKRAPNHFKSFKLSSQREDTLVPVGEAETKEDLIYHFPRVMIKRSAGDEKKANEGSREEHSARSKGSRRG